MIGVDETPDFRDAWDSMSRRADRKASFSSFANRSSSSASARLIRSWATILFA